MAPTGRTPPGTLQDGVNSVFQLFNAEGLGDIVVGARLEATDTIIYLRLRGEKNNWNTLVVFSDLGSHFETVLFRQHDVQNAQVKIMIVKGRKPFFSGLQ